MPDDEQPIERSARRFGYFVLQARTDERSGPEVSGVLENLGTGHKEPFGSSEELARLLREWGARP